VWVGNLKFPHTNSANIATGFCGRPGGTTRGSRRDCILRPKALRQQIILPECARSFDTLNDTSSAVARRWSSQKYDSMSRLGSWSSTRRRSISMWRNGMMELTYYLQRWRYYFVTVEYSSTLCIRINISKNLNIILWKRCFGQICFFFK
jgi:hypothetical protein